MVGAEASHMLDWNVIGRYPRRWSVTTPINPSWQWFCSIGALDEDTLHCAFRDKTNSENYCDVLGHLYRGFYKVLSFLDNACIM